MVNKRYKKSSYNIFSTTEKNIYLFNTLTKAVVEIDDRDIAYVKCMLNNEQIAKKNEKYYEFKSILIENGFLINQEMDEKSVVEYMYKKHRYSDNRLTLVVVPTMKCNLSCYYCFEEEKRMDWEVDNITALKKYIAEYFPSKDYVTMSFFGGEPLLRYKEIKELLKYVTKIKNKYSFDILASITTNGVLLTQEKIDYLVDEGYTNAFQLTIDGNKKSHNTRRVNQDGIPTYEKILYNFKLLIKKICF